MPGTVPIRTSRARLCGGLPVLLALLLGVLQAGVPFGHALLHIATARAHLRQAVHRSAPELRGVVADERGCPLCATDETPALPGPRPPAAALHTARAQDTAVPARARSSEPLQVFCRPPPLA